MIDRPRRRLRIFAILIAVGFGALAVASWWAGREDLRAGSKVTAEGGPALRIDDVPTTYHVVYRTENHAGNALVVNTEKVWVMRPFTSRIESWRGAPPGTERLSVRQSSFGILTNVSGSTTPLNIAVPPSLASGDLRIDAALAEAVSDRTVWRRERREVYGRACQVYRAGGPVFAGDLERYEPRSGEYADVCVDRTGLMLEEAWFSKGRLLNRRVATEVRTGEPIDPELLAIGVPEQEGFERGAVERLVPGSPTEGLWVLDQVPRGFEVLGRYGVAIPPSAIPQTSQFLPIAPTSTADVYVRGPDLLVVDQDPSLEILTRQEGRFERKIELPNLKEAKLIVDARMNEVRGQDEDGSIVRIYGTIAPSELIELARGLRRA
ncbi:MAG: hypothetical protein ACREQY_21500 [Candidatus Binatia bacterium]